MHTPIVQKLVDYLDSDSSFKQAFQNSFTLAYATGLDEFKEYDVHCVDDYLNFMDVYVNWVPSENFKGDNVYMHICLFYFIIDLPPVREFQSPIDPSSKSPWRWMSEWLIEYAQAMGQWMDSPESISPESIQTFYRAPNYHMEDYPVPAEGWKTFNDFFARHIDASLRPISDPTDDRVIVSPADCTFDGTWEINDPGADITTFDVKGVPWSIAQLLDDMDMGALFAGGIFTHSFLSPTDYHRQHAPVSGTVVCAKVVPGLCYLEVVLQESKSRSSGMKLGMHRHLRSTGDAKTGQRVLPMPAGEPGLEAPDSPGYQFLQARGVIIIDNPVLGLVAVLPMGMAQVSSVVLSVKEGDALQKGQEISCF
ncbi:hypothetical protein EXIGLDRAFT_434018, partial [Exidia glandulosa HHB12029]